MKVQNDSLATKPKNENIKERENKMIKKLANDRNKIEDQLIHCYDNCK